MQIYLQCFETEGIQKPGRLQGLCERDSVGTLVRGPESHEGAC
jgi:hypothetical protein